MTDMSDKGNYSIMSTPGTVIRIPFKSMHTAVSGDEGAKAVVFRVHTKGEPHWRVLTAALKE